MEDKVESFASLGLKPEDIINFVYQNKDPVDEEGDVQLRDTMGFETNI